MFLHHSCGDGAHGSGVSIAITFASLLLYVIRVGFWTTAVSSDSASRIT